SEPREPEEAHEGEAGEVAVAPADPVEPSRPPAPSRAAVAAQERLAVPIERLDELVRLVGETVAGQLRLGVLLREALGRDPEGLLHLVRNAVDHGVEPTEERGRAGKDPEAVIGLEAEQNRSEAIVTFSDDGRGINLQHVRDRARRTGGPQHEISDEEALGLIF